MINVDPDRHLDNIIRDMPKQRVVAALVGYCRGIARSPSLGDSAKAELVRLADEAWDVVCENKEPA